MVDKLTKEQKRLAKQARRGQVLTERGEDPEAKKDEAMKIEAMKVRVFKFATL